MNGLKGTGEILRRYNTKQSLPLEPKCTSMNQIETIIEPEIEQYWDQYETSNGKPSNRMEINLQPIIKRSYIIYLVFR